MPILRRRLIRMNDDEKHGKVYRRALTKLCEQAGGEITVDVSNFHSGGNLMHRLEPLDENTVRIRFRFIPESSGSGTQ